LQPIEFDDAGIVRFRTNPLVRYLLDAGPFDMNHLARLPNISSAAHAQFAQLTGYSVSGYGELSYATRVGEADAIAEQLIAKREALEPSEPANEGPEPPKGYRWLKRNEKVPIVACWYDESPHATQGMSMLVTRERHVYRVAHNVLIEAHRERNDDWPSGGHGLCGIIEPTVE
jgi:hypothetical protein